MNKKNKKIIHKKVLRKPINKDIFDYLLLKIDELETEDIVKFNKKLLNVILYYTGLRISEVLLLNKKNIIELAYIIYNIIGTKENSKLTVKKIKTNTQKICVCCRWIYLQKNMKTKFISHFDSNLFENINRKGIVNRLSNKLILRTATRWMEPYFDMLEDEYGGSVLGLNGKAWGFHSYRVNYINNVIRSGNIDQARKLIGHKNVETTLIYFRKQPMTEIESVDILENAGF